MYFLGFPVSYSKILDGLYNVKIKAIENGGKYSLNKKRTGVMCGDVMTKTNK